LAANDWFNNRSGVQRAPLIRNQLRAIFGGPIKKDKASFFSTMKDSAGRRQPDHTRRSHGTISGGRTRLYQSNAGCDGTARFASQPNLHLLILRPRRLPGLTPRDGDNAALLSFINGRYPKHHKRSIGPGDGINTAEISLPCPPRESQTCTRAPSITISPPRTSSLCAGTWNAVGLTDDFNTSIVEFAGDPAPNSRDRFTSYRIFVVGNWAWDGNPDDRIGG